MQIGLSIKVMIAMERALDDTSWCILSYHVFPLNIEVCTWMMI